MKILGIDPGPELSGYCIYDTETAQPSPKGRMQNQLLLSFMTTMAADAVAIEAIRPYGVNSCIIINTCEAVGAFKLMAMLQKMKVYQMDRPDVLDKLIGDRKAKKPQLRAYLYERFDHKGNCKSKGPLNGFDVHALDALAVALAVAEDLNAAQAE